ncbi:hypothetical protein [Streptosporangium sp. H16]|uniref:hypothetical protein n=1 Tax=Streptosporangium sp. H16 TaxID=3444184 RepID=UPI003F7B13A5
MPGEADDWPKPIWTCWNHWIAVSTGDQPGIMRILGLSRPEPITFSQAQEVIDADGHDESQNRRHLFRVFVTPAVEGWTLVFGTWCDPYDKERREDVLRLCRELSARYGQAQAYYYGAQDDGSTWLVTRRGTVVRRYSATGEGDDGLLALGDPLPQERTAWCEQLGYLADWDPATASYEQADEWQRIAFGLTPEIAAAHGISPLALNRDTQARGTGVLALTPYATAHE